MWIKYRQIAKFHRFNWNLKQRFLGRWSIFSINISILRNWTRHIWVQMPVCSLMFISCSSPLTRAGDNPETCTNKEEVLRVLVSWDISLGDQVLNELLLTIIHIGEGSLLWVLMCDFSLLLWANFFWQYLHEYGFSLVWVRMCVFRCSRRLNLFWQYSHWNGLSLVCIRIWLLSVLLAVNLSWQCSHWYGFSLVWILKWRFKQLLS